MGKEKGTPGFWQKLFMDNNDLNEKAVVGFGAFIALVITLVVDLATGLMGQELPIHEFVFDGFMVITLGAFGIASVDKFINKGKNKGEDEGLEG
jgi:tetrahydromethanopterin S-methyltransferase subunit E